MTMVNISKDLDQFIIDVTNDLVDDIYQGVRQRTPVVTGTAKAGWIKQTINQVGESGLVANDVEYINYLEDGTPATAPRNMVKATLTEIESKR